MSKLIHHSWPMLCFQLSTRFGPITKCTTAVKFTCWSMLSASRSLRTSFSRYVFLFLIPWMVRSLDWSITTLEITGSFLSGGFICTACCFSGSPPIQFDVSILAPYWCHRETGPHWMGIQHPQPPQSSPRFADKLPSSWMYRLNIVVEWFHQEGTSTAWTRISDRGWSFGIACSAPSRRSCPTKPSSTDASIRSNRTTPFI